MVAHRLGPGGGVVSAVALVVAMFVLDWVTAAPISFAPLYVAPVALAAVAAGRWPGLGVAALALAADALIDTILGRVPADVVVFAWDLVSVGVAYGIVVQLVTTRAALLERERLYRELEAATREIKTLRGLLPVCAWCGEIRDDERGEWQPLEEYVAEHTDAAFTHGICPSCAERVKQGAPPPG